MQKCNVEILGKQLKMFFMGLLLMALPGCFSQGEKQASLTIINLLDEKMYEDCHIKGSINVPFTQFEHYMTKLDKNSEIVVYCSNYFCTASSYAWKMLNTQGFTHIWAYEGGTAEWHQKGLPTSGPAAMPYLKKVIEKPEENAEKITTISAEDLLEKMKQHEIIK